jgi:hypothetical protein
MTTIVPLRPEHLRKFPRTGVVGEIKPNNDAGIAAGIRQLVRRTADRRSATPQLLTYSKVNGNPRKYEVLAADPTELRAIIAAWRAKTHYPRPTLWYRLGSDLDVPQAVDLIPRWKCPTQLGNLVEGPIRARYAMQLGIGLPAKSPSRPGADITHELQEMAEFLRELAAELEAEAGYRLP